MYWFYVKLAFCFCCLHLGLGFDACPPYRYGPDCDQRCNTSCYRQICNYITGLCDIGCNNFKDPPNCKIPCHDSHGHGFNCLCHSYCKECHNTTAKCLSCKRGFVYSASEYSCHAGVSILHSLHAEPEETNHNLMYIPFAIFLVAITVAVIGVLIHRYKSNHSIDQQGEG